MSDKIEGESREVGKVPAALARGVACKGQPFSRPCVIFSDGETTVTLKKLPEGVVKGQGGQAGELCLGLVWALQGQSGVYTLAADTDSIDGVQDNAGAFLWHRTRRRAHVNAT